ncbi:MAG: DUF4249 domain-containing protein [Bacteroidetes bacterium]|nr:DUF4249 domain-containing protein [Bacteroidota bacterium]
MIFLTFGCIKKISPPIRESNPILVVEGIITTQPPPYSIKLSYSGHFTTSYIDSTQIFINDAKVTIADDNGDSSVCKLTSQGNYQSNDSNFIGIVGHTYTLKVYLANGKTYISKPETILPVSAIDSVSVVYDSSTIENVRPNQFIVSAHSLDPGDKKNYYRWTSSGYFPRKSWGEPCVPFGPSCADPYMCTCYALCEQYVEDTKIDVLSDKLIDGREINQPVFSSPIYWYGKHFIEIKEYSLTEAAYSFWEQYLGQTSRTGGILDPLPAPLLGNVYNQADRNDIALGLFSASDVYVKKIIIVPFSLQLYWLKSTASQYIEQGDCHYTYPNSLPDNTEPLGWGNADIIEIH